MRRLFTIIALTTLMFAVPSQAYAIFIVDTGAGTAGSMGLFHHRFGRVTYGAGQFTTTQTHTVTDIEGWILGRGASNAISLVIYNDAGILPDTASEIFRQSFIPVIESTYSWQGLTGLNLNLDAGTYWAAFEVLNVNNSANAEWGNGAPNPLSRYALSTNRGPAYSPFAEDSVAFGFRVQALDQQMHTAPEPTTMLLFGSGMVGAFIRRRKQT